MTVIIDTIRYEARQLIRQELESYFADNPIISTPVKKENRIVDLEGLLNARPILGSKSTIYKRTANCTMPFSRRGKKLFFDLEQIDNWLLANQAKGADQLLDETFDFLQEKSR